MKRIIRVFQVIVVLLASVLLASCDKYFEVTLDPKENIIVEESVNLKMLLENTLITIRVIPPDGKEVDKFTIDGVEKELEDLKYRLTVVRNHLVKVTFKDAEIPTDFKLILGEGLSADVENLDHVAAGSKVNITINVPEGKVIDQFMVDGVVTALSSNTYELTITKQHEISVTFKDIPTEPAKFTVTLTGTSLNSTDSLTGLLAGAKVNIKITVPAGKEIDEFKVDDVVVNLKGALVYQLTVSKDHKVTVTFKDKPAEPAKFTVTLMGTSLNSNDSLTGLLAGAKVNIKITVPAGKEVDEFKVDGDVVNLKGALVYQLTVSKDHKITVTFKDKPAEPAKFTVTLMGTSLSSNDSLTDLLVGAKVNINITVPDDKEIDEFKVDDDVVNLEGALVYQLTVSQNHKVTVTFKDKPAKFTVTLMGTSLSSNDSLTDLLVGAKVNINITVPDDKEIDEFKVDGDDVNLEGALVYQLTVSQNHKVTVTFKDKPLDPGKFKVSLGNDLNSNDPLFNVDEGAKVNITIKVPDGKEVDEFKVDNVVIDLAGASTYELTVSQNHKVSVSFKIKQYTVKFMLNDGLFEQAIINHGKSVEDPDAYGRIGFYVVWELNGEEYDFSQLITENIELIGRIIEPLNIKVFGSETNQYILKFNKDVNFNVDVSQKLKFLQSLFGVEFDFSIINLDAVTINYSDLQLTITFDKDLISSETLQQLEYESDGNGIFRVPLILRVDQIKSKDYDMIYNRPVEPHILRLNVPFGDGGPDYTQSVETKVYNLQHPNADVANDPVVRYDVSFVSEEIEFSQNITVKHGDTINVLPELEYFGFVLTGWLVNGEEFDFTTKVRSKLLLRARWEDSQSVVKVNFNTRSPQKLNPAFYENGNLVIEPKGLTLDGYNLVGWELDGEEFDFSVPLVKTTDEITLVAKWEAIEVPVYINLNGGTGQEVIYYPYDTYVDAAHILRDMEIPKKEGFVFGGFEGLIALLNGDLILHEPITLNVHWLPIDDILTFHVYDELTIEIPISRDFIFLELIFPFVLESVENMFGNEMPQREGYVYDGVYATSDYDLPVTAEKGLNSVSLDYYLKWRKIEQDETDLVTITIESNCETLIDPIAVAKGTIFQDALGVTEDKIHQIENENRRFYGWYLDEALKYPLQYNMVVQEDITIYVEWLLRNQPPQEDPEAPKEYVWISFKTDSPTEIDPLKVEKGTLLYPVLRSLPPLNLPGYQFAGWYNQNLTFQLDSPQFAYLEVLQDVTVYAKWVKLNKITYYLGEEVYGFEYVYDVDRPLKDLQSMRSLSFEYEIYLDSELTEKLNDSPQYESKVVRDLNLYLKPKTNNYANITIFIDDVFTITIDSVYKFSEYNFLVDFGEAILRNNKKSVGFYLDEAHTIPLNENDPSDYIVDGNLFIYTKFIDVCYVTIDMGVPLGDHAPALFVFEKGEPFENIYEELEEYIFRPYYNVEGLYLDSEFTQPISNLDGTLFNENLRLYVKWETIEITIDSNDKLPTYQIRIANIRDFQFWHYQYELRGTYLDSDYTLWFNRNRDELVSGQTLYLEIYKVYWVKIIFEYWDDDRKFYDGIPLIEQDFWWDWEENRMIVGWKLNGTEIDMFAPFHSDAEENELTPIWGPKEMVSLYFKINGEIDHNLTRQVLKNHRFTYNPYPIPQAPEKDQYIFLYWTDEDGNAFNQNTFITKEMTLTPFYEPFSYVTVTFDTDVEGMEIEPIEVLKYSNIDNLLPIITKEGYWLWGWLKPNGVLYRNEQILEDITLSAHWIPCETVKATVDIGFDREPIILHLPKEQHVNEHELYQYLGNISYPDYELLGFTVNDVQRYSFYPTTDVAIKLIWSVTGPVTITFQVDGQYFGERTYDHDKVFYGYGEPEKENHVFLYWTLDGVEFPHGSMITDNITLEAFFVPHTYVEVTFITNIPNLELPPLSVLSYSYINEPYWLTKEGNRFKRWELDGEAFDFNSRITDSITLSAVWEPWTTYELVINIGHEIDPIILYIPSGGWITANFIKNNFGIDFENMIEDHDYMGLQTEDGNWFYDNMIMNSDVTFNVIWQDNRPFTATFNIDGEYWYELEYTYDKVFHGLTAPEKDNYIFVYWTLDGVEFPIGSTITGNITLEAYYVLREYATLSFNTNVEGLVIDDVITIKHLPYRDGLPLITKQNHVFVGWFLDGKEFIVHETIVTGDMTLEAVWESAETITVTIDPGYSLEPRYLYIPKQWGVFMHAQNIKKYYGAVPDMGPYAHFEYFELDGVQIYEFELIDDIYLTIKWFSHHTDIFINFYDDENNYLASHYMNRISVITSFPFVEPKGDRVFAYWLLDGERFNESTVVTHNIDLIAHYVTRETLYISFNTGIEGVTIDPVETYKYADLRYFVIPHLNQEGQRFLYWALDGVPFDFGKTRVMESMTLEPVWEEYPTYALTFNFPGVDLAPVTLHLEQNLIIDFLDFFTQKYCLANANHYLITNENYRIDHFEYDGETINNFELVGNATIDIIVNDYSPITVRYFVGEELVHSEMKRKNWRFYTNIYDEYVSSHCPEGNTFAYWKLNGDEYPYGTLMLTDMDLYAHFVPIEYKTVTFESGFDDINIDPQEVIIYGYPNYIPAISKEGHRFLYWTIDGERIQSYQIREDITLVAVWEPAETHTVTIDAGEGFDLISIYVADGDFLHNNMILRHYNFNFEKSGYRIEGLMDVDSNLFEADYIYNNFILYVYWVEE
ncbi:MAG: InlB B-repeat-containing protein [Acholeplasmataceae bacterium]